MLRNSVLAAAAVALAATAPAQTADDVIARSIEARGGLAAIRAVQAVRMTGRFKMGEVEGAITVELRRPSSIRTDMRAEGRSAVQGYDGQRAWAVSPMGAGMPEALPAEAARQMAQQADIEGALVDYKAKGHRAELAGQEKVDGSDAWRVKLTLAAGDVEYYLIDARSWLPVRVEATRRVGQRQIEGETRLRDYRDSGGWKWPHTIVNVAKGGPGQQTISFDSIEVNPTIEDARFRMPGTRGGTTR